MTTDFDPYHRWLGIPPEEQPPNHYRLLGVAVFESNLDVIETAADRQMAHVRTFQTGPRSAVSQQLLNEIATAKVCLLNPNKRLDYDAQLRQRLERRETLANPQWVTATEPQAAVDAIRSRSGPEIIIQAVEKTERMHRTRPASRNPAILVSAVSVLLLAIVAAIAAATFSRGSGPGADADPGALAGLSPPPNDTSKSETRPSPDAEDRRPREPRPSSGNSSPGGQQPLPAPAPAIDGAPRAGSDGGIVGSDGVLDFRGRGHVEIANSRGLAGPDKSFTAEVWYRPPVDPAPEPLFVMGDAAMGGGHPDLPAGTIRGWYLQYLRQPQTPERCSLRLYSPDSAQRAAGVIVSLPRWNNRWHHIAVCNELVDGGGRRQAIFLDGNRLVDRTWPPATPRESLTNLFLGCSPYSTPPHRFAGQVRAFRLSGTFRYVTSSFTPEQDFRQDNDTLVLLDFSSATGTTLADLSGNGHEGKLFEASGPGSLSSSSTAPASPPAPIAVKTRHAAPADDELQQQLALVRDVFREELSGADAPAKKLALASQLAEQAAQEADLVTRFAMLTQARQLALEGLDWETASSILGQLEQQYEIEGLSMKAEAFRTLATATKTDDGRRAAIETAMRLVDQFSENDRYDLAENVLDVASSTARRLRDANVTRAIREKARINSDAGKLWDVARSARETLAASPDDTDANLKLGKYLAFVKDSWDDALPHLQKGADPVLAQLAQKDLEKPNDPQQRVELAEGWSKWGDAASGSDQLGAWRRGQHWYVQAVPRLSGLMKTQAGKRLEELSEQISPSAPFQGLRLAWLETDVGLVRSFDAHQGPVSALAVSRSGKLLVSVSEDGTAKVWDLASGRALRELQLPPQHSKFRIHAVALSPDDNFVVAGGQSDSILVWNLDTGAPTGQIKTRPLTDLAISPDGRRLIWGMYPSGGNNSPAPRVGVWDIKAGRPAGQISCRGSVRSVDISPTSRLGVTGDSMKMVQIWDLATGNLVRSMDGHAAEIFDVAFSPDGRKVASSSYDDVRIWDARTGKQLHVISYPNGSHRLSFSPDSRRLACSGWMETVVLWDADSGEQLMRFRANPGGSPQHMKTVAYLPDPRGMVGGSANGKVYVWKLPD